MKRFILTGAPGAGKTAIIRQLEVDGFGVVEEAATDVIAAAQVQGIAEPWRDFSFIDSIVDLQKQRQVQSAKQPCDMQFHDRSVFCTAVLARYLGYRFSSNLMAELERVKNESVFESKVFFVRNLGFVAPTAARRISFEQAQYFERLHEEIYRQFGFELLFVEAGNLPDRVAQLREAVGVRVRNGCNKGGLELGS